MPRRCRTSPPPATKAAPEPEVQESLTSRIGERLSQVLTNIRLNPVYVRRQRKLEGFLRDVPVVGTPAERAVEAFKAAVREFLQPPSFFESLGVRYVGPVDGHDIPELEQAFRNAIELSAVRADRRPRPDPEGSRLPARRGRRREAPPRRPGVRPDDRTAEGRADRATRRRSPMRSSRRARPTRASSRSRRRCRARPGCCRSRRASPTASSTSASPSSTPSPAPPAWRWADCARSSRSTRRSSTGRGTRSSTTSGCTASRSCSASTGPASPGPTGRATTACTTWRCWPACRACGCSRRPVRRNCTRCCTTR